MKTARRHIHPGTLIWKECQARDIPVPDDLVGVAYDFESVTEEMAVDIATLFGTSVELWLNLQASYDEWPTPEQKGD